MKGDSNSSKMSATMIGRGIKCWVAEQLKREISHPFQLDSTYSKLSFLATELTSLPLLLIEI